MSALQVVVVVLEVESIWSIKLALYTYMYYILMYQFQSKIVSIFSNNDDVEEMVSNTPEPVSANTFRSVSRRLFSNALDPDISTNNAVVYKALQDENEKLFRIRSQLSS